MRLKNVKPAQEINRIYEDGFKCIRIPKSSKQFRELARDGSRVFIVAWNFTVVRPVFFWEKVVGELGRTQDAQSQPGIQFLICLAAVCVEAEDVRAAIEPKSTGSAPSRRLWSDSFGQTMSIGEPFTAKARGSFSSSKRQAI
jgi:hypothetical protein